MNNLIITWGGYNQLLLLYDLISSSLNGANDDV